MFLNGQEVRHRAAELASADPGTKSQPETARDAQRHIVWLSEQVGIPVGTLHNVTREANPQTISITKAFDLAKALRRTHESVKQVFDAITADDPEEQPAETPAEQPTQPRRRDPSAPPGRSARKDPRGPRRDDMQEAS